MPVPTILYRGMFEPNSWARYLVNKTMRYNDNNLVSIIGQTGSGKTYAGLSIAEMMTKKSGVPFPIENVVFSLDELMRLINSDKLKRGSVVVFDEPQVSIGAKDFQSLANKVFNLLASTFRHRNLTLFFCTPAESLLDRSTRRLFKGRFKTDGIDRKNNYCHLNPYVLEWGEKEDAYAKRLQVFFKQNGVRRQEKISRWSVPLPSKELIKDYEIKKRKFTDNLNKNIMQKIDEFNATGKSMTAEYKVKDNRKPLTDRQKEVVEVLVHGTIQSTADNFGVSTTAIHDIKHAIIKKGYEIKEFATK